MRTKKINKLLTLFTAFALAFAMIANPMQAVAGEIVETEITIGTEDGEVVQPLAHKSYYPTSGSSAGVFYGNLSSVASYTLPAGVIKISYSIEGAGTCYLRFYYGGTLVAMSGALTGNTTGTSSVTLPASGNYTVQLYYQNGSSSSEVIYAYNLYTE